MPQLVRTRGGEALKYWFSVGTHAVWNWRKRFGIGHWGTEGSQRLHELISEAGAAQTRDEPLPPEQVKRRQKTARALNLGRFLKKGYHGRWWTVEEATLLGTIPDAKVAVRIGRTVNAVRIERTRRGIASPPDRRCGRGRIRPRLKRMKAEIIGQKEFVDGITRAVFADEHGQFVLDGMERVYGQWLTPEDDSVDQPLVVPAG